MTLRTDAIPQGPPVRAGDLLYAVGPGRPRPHSATDLLVYSTPVRGVHPAVINGGVVGIPGWSTFSIELTPDRPRLGFPKGIYQGYELGISEHRSPTEALRAFAEKSRRRRHQAERECAQANEEIKFALGVLDEITAGSWSLP